MNIQTNELNVFLKQKVFSTHIKNLLIKILYPFRNRFILFNVTAKAQKNRVNLNYWWEKPNLGDELSQIVVRYMLNLHNIPMDKPVHGIKHLYAIGSIITAGLQDCTIWGSGILCTTMLNRVKGRKFDIRSVRGPVSRIILLDMGYEVPEIYGDPAIILSEIYVPSIVEKKYKYGVIIHKDQKFISSSDKAFMKRHDVLVIDIRTRNYERFVNQVVSCEKIISSSLHGIIISETYRTPVLMHRPTSEPLLKYFDWYYSTERFFFPIAHNLDEVITLNAPPLPNLTKLRDEQKRAFPYDLYEI